MFQEGRKESGEGEGEEGVDPDAPSFSPLLPRVEAYERALRQWRYAIGASIVLRRRRRGGGEGGGGVGRGGSVRRTKWGRGRRASIQSILWRNRRSSLLLFLPLPPLW